MLSRWTRAAVLAALVLQSLVVAAAGALGPAELRSRHASLAPQLASNAFGGPLVLQSEEAARRVDGHVYAILDHPLAAVSAALADPAQWCEILILHLNTKYCRRGEEGGVTLVQMRVGRKVPQELESTSPLSFTWRKPVLQADYLAVDMDAERGPYDTRDYRLYVEAVPLDGRRTFLHLGYALAYGGASQFALNLYLATVGRDKVGFTRVSADRSGQEGYVDGMRSVVERNTMRYYLAINAYLQSLSAPAEQQLEQRLQAWFDATEKYPRQLHEVDRDAYLRMKRAEVRRQAAPR